MNNHKSARAFIAVVAILNSMAFLIFWMVIVAVSLNDEWANQITGYPVYWVSEFIKLFADDERIRFFLLILFPAIFSYVPIKICQFFYRRFGVRHVNQ